MVPLIVFYLHVVAFGWGFTRRWQEEGLAEGILAVVFMALIFFVGWGMASFLLKLLMPPEGFGRLFDRDAAGLVLLTVMEGALYFFTFRRDRADEGQEPV
jgi:hypothetical protein